MRTRFSLAQFALALGLLVLATPTARSQNWTRTAIATASDGSPWDLLGTAVALSGDTLVLGAPQSANSAPGPGAAYVFERALGTWTEVAKLRAADGSDLDHFGSAVAVEGDVVVVGAQFDDDAGREAGAVYVFERNTGGANTFVQVAKLTASDGHSWAQFGHSLDLDGSLLAVGAPHDSVHGIFAGAVYTFARDGAGSWSEEQKLVSVTGTPSEELGLSVAVHGATLVAGAPGAWAGSGAAIVFERRSGTGWTETQRITSDHTEDQFGRSVSLSEDTLVFGAAGHENGGAAYVFAPGPGGMWIPRQTLSALSPFAGALFGTDVSVSGSRMAVGDQLTRIAYLFERDASGAWTETASLQPCTETGSHGYVVAVSADALVAGAPADEINGFASGAGYVYESLPQTAPTTYCTAGFSVAGCRALIRACGVPSAAATRGLLLGARDIDPNKKAFFFYGTSGRQAVQWGNGTSYQCVAPPVRRTPARPAEGLPTGCGWSYSEDLAAHWASAPGSHPGAGATVRAQLWFRDAFNTSGMKSSLSDAVEFRLLP
jgi:hypothetical protein